MLIDLKNIKVVSLADFDLEKAAFKHGYYTHLVPKKVVGKDGVERIHWVNPDKDKKTKLARVSHHREGTEAEHHAEINQKHVIDPKDLQRFSEGDKVVVSWGADKGREGVFRGDLAGPSPRVSVALFNPKTGKHDAKTMNVNHIKLVHRADEETKKVVERKTVEVTNLKGETILVDRGDFEKYYKDRDKKKTVQERVAEEARRLVVGGVYRRPDGRMIGVESSLKVGSLTRYSIRVVDRRKKADKSGKVDEGRLQAILDEQKYERVPRPMITKEAKTFDEDDGTWKKWVSDKPLSADLESGELHRKGHFGYDSKTGMRVPTEADEDIARKILAEHWSMLERTVSNRVAKYSTVPDGEISPADIIDGLTKAVASYEPLLDTGGGIEGRLRQYADSYARSEAEKIHERETATVRDDLVREDGDTTDAPITSAVDKAAVKEMLGDLNDIMASAFVSKQDAMILEEGLADEADMMSWLYGDEKILDVMKRWTGIGVFESTITKKEAAAELTGLAYNPATMEPYATSTIETLLLPRELDRITEAFKNEGMVYPEFMATLKKDVNLRNKLARNRKIVPVHPKDEKVIAVVREKVKESKGRAIYAAQLIRRGVSPRYAPVVMQLGDRIMAGRSVPDDYAKQLPREVWKDGAKALTQWFKDQLPVSVFAGKRAAAFNLPQRFDVEGPINKAIADEKRLKEENEQAASREYAKMGKEPPAPPKPTKVII